MAAKRRNADAAARAEAKAVVERWNEQLAAGRDMLFFLRAGLSPLRAGEPPRRFPHLGGGPRGVVVQDDGTLARACCDSKKRGAYGFCL